MKKSLQCLREIWFYLVLAILACLLIPERSPGSFRMVEYTKRAIGVAQSEMSRMKERMIVSRQLSVTPALQDSRKSDQ